MAQESPVDVEPSLRVKPQPPPPPLPPPRSSFRRRKAVRLSFYPALALGLLGLVLVGANSLWLLPFHGITVVEGKLGSKAEIFEDAEIQRLFLKHHVRVHATPSESRVIATHSVAGFDFAMPSGQPAADLLMRNLSAEDEKAHKNLKYTRYHPFSTPIVLGSFRGYAETLVDNMVATPLAIPDRAGSFYYRLDMEKFLKLVKAQKSWNKIGVQKHGIVNGNVVLAATSDLCGANSAATYLGLVSFVENDEQVVRQKEAVAKAKEIALLVTGQGQPSPEIFKNYVSYDGPSFAPIAVIYEHQYLARQLDLHDRQEKLDSDRVLLYPDYQFLTEPVLVSLTPKGDTVGRLLTRDPEIRQRLVELGFRLLPNPTGPQGTQLDDLLRQRQVPSPELPKNQPVSQQRTLMPDVLDLEKMITSIVRCQDQEDQKKGAPKQ